MKLSFSLPSLLCFYWGVIDDKNCIYLRYTTWYFGVHCEIIINKLINNPSPHIDAIFFFILLFWKKKIKLYPLTNLKYVAAC